MEYYQLDLLLITETRQILDEKLIGPGSPLIVRGSGTKFTGIAVAVPQHNRIHINSSNDRLIHLSHQSGVDIIGVYGPIEGTKPAVKQAFWKSLKQLIDATEDRPTIITGDFNAGHEYTRHPSSMGEGPSNYERLLDLVTTYGFELLEHGPTWISPKAEAAKNSAPGRTLDRCLVRCPTNYSAHATVDFILRPADHAVLYTTVQFLEINRDTGRPQHTPMSDIGRRWQKTKLTLNKVFDQVSPLIALSEFWKAKQQLEREDREQLKIVTDDGKVLSAEVGVIHVASYLKTLWNVETITYPKPPVEVHFNSPTTDEIEQAIGRLKVDTAMGKDRVNPRHLKGNPAAITAYQSILHEVWKQEELPAQWKDLRIKPIPKKTTPARPNEVRPITCVATSAKIMNDIIIQRNRRTYETALHPSQHAYRLGHSTATAITQLLTAITAKNLRVVTFLDISKAYDSVTMTAIRAALARWNLPPKERNLVIEQYNCQIFVELNGYTAPPFTHRRGVRQGCALSCMIFALIVSGALDYVESKLVNNVELISYSDDIVIAAANVITAKVATKYLEEALAMAGLAINTNKTTTVHFNDNQYNEPTTTCWLGCTLTPGLTWQPEILNRLQKMRDAETHIHRILTSRRLHTTDTDKIQIIQSLVAVHARLPSFIKQSPHHTEEQAQLLETQLIHTISKLTTMEGTKPQNYAKRMLQADIPKRDQPLIKCPFCSKTVIQKNGLTVHLQVCSLNPNPPAQKKAPCPRCGEFKATRAMATHTKFCKKNQILH